MSASQSGRPITSPKQIVSYSNADPITSFKEAIQTENSTNQDLAVIGERHQPPTRPFMTRQLSAQINAIQVNSNIVLEQPLNQVNPVRPLTSVRRSTAAEVCIPTALNLQNIQGIEIAVPLNQVSRNDKLMHSFIDAVTKAKFSQAGGFLARISSDYPLYNFNLAVQKFLERDFVQATQIFKQLGRQADHNLELSLEKLQIQKQTCDSPTAQMNFDEFKRTFNFAKQKPKPLVKDEAAKEAEGVINDWDLFLIRVQKYRERDFKQFCLDRAYFESVLQNVRRICGDEVKLNKHIVSKIQKKDLTDCPENVVNTTVLKSRDNLLHIQQEADHRLETNFKEMINQCSTYCVGIQDPVEDSFDNLIEGLRAFHEKVGLDQFCLDFCKKIAQKNTQVVSQWLKKFDSSENVIKRAKIFAMSCFRPGRDECNDQNTINFLMNIVNQAEENKLRKFLDPERFKIEQNFNKLIQDIIHACRRERGSAPMTADDQHWIDRLNFYRDISERNDEGKLLRLTTVTKHQLGELRQHEKQLERPLNFDLIEPNPRVPRQLRKEIDQKLQTAIENHRKKPLSTPEREKNHIETQKEIALIDQQAYQNWEKNQELKSNPPPERTNLEKVARRQELKKEISASMRSRVQRKRRQMMMRKKEKNLQMLASMKEGQKTPSEQQNKASLEHDLQELEVVSSCESSDEKQFVFQDNHMQVMEEPLETGTVNYNLWDDAACVKDLQYVFFNIQRMCHDERVIFERDEEKQRPQLLRWGINVNAKPLEIAASSVGRPKIGQKIPKSQLDYLKEMIPRVNDLFASQLQRLDETLVACFRFFSIVDPNVRQTLYKSIQLMHWPVGGTLIEEDAEESEYVYITIQGKVNYMMFKFDTKVTCIVATYRAGEVFGDGSIQRQFFDVLKILSKDRKYLETDHDDVYALRIPKQQFVSAIFEEMAQELMYKILLFRKTPYFKELSPYSLIMFASICQVRECRYGEIITEQGKKPDACYILAYGRCKSVYKYPEIRSTEVSRHAKKVLRRNPPPNFITGPINYRCLPAEQRRRFPGADQKITIQTESEDETEENQQDENRDALGAKVKRACNYKEIKLDKKKDELTYEHHIDFDDIREGDVICSRVLLDNQTFKKHISLNSLRFSDSVGITHEQIEKEVKLNDQQKTSQKDQVVPNASVVPPQVLSEGKVSSGQQLVLESAFCKSCFEKNKAVCLCGEQQMDKQKRLADRQGTNKNQFEMSSQDSDSPVPLEKFDQYQNQQENPTYSSFDQNEGIKEVEGHTTLSSSSAKRLEVEQRLAQTQIQLEEEINVKLVDRLHDSLVRSQTSIVVTTATAKLIQIRKEDKSFLNEALKQSVDKVILDQDFADFDRPLANFEQVKRVVAEERGWLRCKAQKQEETLFQAKFSRKTNPLISDD